MASLARDYLAFGIDLVRNTTLAAARGLAREIEEARADEAMRTVRSELSEIASATAEGRPADLDRLPRQDG